MEFKAKAKTTRSRICTMVGQVLAIRLRVDISESFIACKGGATCTHNCCKQRLCQMHSILLQVKMVSHARTIIACKGGVTCTHYLEPAQVLAAENFFHKYVLMSLKALLYQFMLRLAPEFVQGLNIVCGTLA